VINTGEATWIFIQEEGFSAERKHSHALLGVGRADRGRGKNLLPIIEKTATHEKTGQFLRQKRKREKEGRSSLTRGGGKTV